IRWIDGRMVRLEIATDITERKKVEQELISKKTQLEHISDNLDEAMIYQLTRYDDDRREINYVSARAREFYGMSPEELKSDPALMYGRVHPEDIQRVICGEMEALRVMKPFKTEARMLNPDGSIRWSYFISVPQQVAGGTRWDGVEFNITERKRSEEALREALNIKSAFTSMVSHELRTPLTVIRESIFLMSRGLLGPINEKQKRHLEMEEKNVTRLSNLLGQVLDYQAMEAGKLKFSMEKNDINAVIRDAYATMSSLAEKKGLQLNLDLDEGLPEFEFDRDRIVEVIINLLSNAIKLTDRGGVTVKSARLGARVRVSVTDTGPGIRQEDIPRLFRHFEQLYRLPGGTGLGLAISKNIILAHDGEIWPESVYGQGTTFHFEIPIERRGGHGEKNPDSE
ncbi:MAG TPA: ATP-binding protein, partial [bacterium]|nr:ATP-binding protein [bacterium]